MLWTRRADMQGCRHARRRARLRPRALARGPTLHGRGRAPGLLQGAHARAPVGQRIRGRLRSVRLVRRQRPGALKGGHGGGGRVAEQRLRGGRSGRERGAPARVAARGRVARRQHQLQRRRVLLRGARAACQG